jgi:hypothetical protein
MYLHAWNNNGIYLISYDVIKYMYKMYLGEKINKVNKKLISILT